MGGGKKRERIHNPEPFLTDESNKSFSKKRTKPSKLHQQEQKVLLFLFTTYGYCLFVNKHFGNSIFGFSLFFRLITIWKT